MPNWAEVEGCDEKRCTAVNGDPITLSGELPVTVGGSSLTTRLTARVGFLNLEMTLPKDVINGCNAFPNGCPLTLGQTEHIKSTFVVAAPFANISPTIELSLTNQRGERVMCVRTKINLVSSQGR